MNLTEKQKKIPDEFKELAKELDLKLPNNSSKIEQTSDSDSE